MPARLFGLHLTRALHQHARDDLQAVGDTVLQLLQQQALVANQILVQLPRNPRFGDIRNRQQQPDRAALAIVQFVRVQHETARVLPFADQVELIILDLRQARRRGAQQRLQLRDRPFARAERGEVLAGNRRTIHVEGVTEGVARRHDVAMFVEQ